MSDLAADERIMRQVTGESGFVTRRVAGETIIVPVSSRVGDLDAIYTLNDVGSRIWTLIESPRSIDDIVAILCDEYDATRDEIAGDVNALLRELQTNGLIHVANGRNT